MVSSIDFPNKTFLIDDPRIPQISPDVEVRFGADVLRPQWHWKDLDGQRARCAPGKTRAAGSSAEGKLGWWSWGWCCLPLYSFLGGHLVDVDHG